MKIGNWDVLETDRVSHVNPGDRDFDVYSFEFRFKDINIKKTIFAFKPYNEDGLNKYLSSISLDLDTVVTLLDKDSNVIQNS